MHPFGSKSYARVFTGLYNGIVEENSVAIIAGTEAATAKLPSFRARKFLHSAKAALELIIEFSNDDDIEDLLTLVDKYKCGAFTIDITFAVSKLRQLTLSIKYLHVDN